MTARARSTASSRSRPAELAAQYRRRGHVLVEQRHFRRAGERVARRVANACSPRCTRRASPRSRAARTDGAYLRPARTLFARSPADSIDYAVMERRLATSELRPCARRRDVRSSSGLVGSRLVGCRLGCDGQGRRRQRRARPRGVRRRDVELRAFRRPARRLRRHDQRHRGRDGRCGACRRPFTRAGHQGARRAHQGAACARSGYASQGAPPVGLLRFDRSRRPLPGEAHRRHAGRDACRCRCITTVPNTGSSCAARRSSRAAKSSSC